MATIELKQIPIDQLVRGEYQPRRYFDQDALRELADSIKSAGLIQPVVVRPGFKNQFEIIAGERRWRAAQIAGLDAVPCLVRDVTDEQAAAATTIENIQRQDLNPIEEANSYQRLVDEFAYQHDEIALIVGKSRAKISNSIRLLRLEAQVQQLLMNFELSEGHGKVIAGVAVNQQFVFAKKCISQSWSVRQTEQEVKKLQQAVSEVSANDPDLVRLERLLSDQMGSEVKLDPQAKKKGGWLKIRYFDNDTLEGLLDKLGVKGE